MPRAVPLAAMGGPLGFGIAKEALLPPQKVPIVCCQQKSHVTRYFF